MVQIVIRPAVFLSVRSDRLEPLGNKGCETGTQRDGVDKVFEERGAWMFGRVGLWL